MIARESKLLIRGLFTNYLQLVVAFSASFILTPILLHYLGQRTYGLWAVFSSFAAYFMLFDLGLNTSVAKYTAELEALNQRERLGKIVSTSLAVVCFTGLIIVFVCLSLTPLLPKVFGIPAEIDSSAKIAFIVTGINVALWLVAGVFGNIIYGHQRVDVWKTFSIIQLIVNALLTILFLRLGFDLIGVACAAVASTILLMLLYLLFINRSNYGILVRPQFVETKVFKEIAPYSVRTLILGLTSRILWYSGPIIIGIFLGTSSVACFDITYKLCFYTTYLFSIISAMVFPRFSSLYATGDLEKLRLLYLGTVKLTMAIVAVAGITLYFWGSAFISLWVGENNFAGMEVLVLLIAMNFFHGLGSPGVALLQGIGRNKSITYSEIANAALSVLLAILFIRGMDLSGIVVAMLIAHLCTSFWVVQFSTIRSVGLPVKRYFFSYVLPPVLCGVVTGGFISFFVGHLFPIQNYFYLFLNSLAVVLIYSILFVVFGLSNEERMQYLRFFQGCFKKDAVSRIPIE